MVVISSRWRWLGCWVVEWKIIGKCVRGLTINVKTVGSAWWPSGPALALTASPPVRMRVCASTVNSFLIHVQATRCSFDTHGYELYIHMSVYIRIHTFAASFHALGCPARGVFFFMHTYTRNKKCEQKKLRKCVITIIPKLTGDSANVSVRRHGVTRVVNRRCIDYRWPISQRRARPAHEDEEIYSMIIHSGL